ncbi:glycosyl transferase [Butyrivibrio sp. MC2013]|uniref:glycosyl transferase n=1 Tax=Butyrivibrio sp. MC2013 TaxID=1280686 RepID=UPI000402323E|nr:glycosyl transferase [Butyrivibrio sp. MC2013]
MIATELIEGQGLGNQLFAYVTARAVALDRGCEFGLYNPEQFGNNIHSRKGMYFMDIDTGRELTDDERQGMTIWNDAEDRLYKASSGADMTRGIYVSGADMSIMEVEDNTLLRGNLQAESYFAAHRDEIRDWLKVKDEYDSHEYTRDNLCILNMRGGEYSSSPELFLPRSYWLRAMKNMRALNPDMEFMIVTDDTEAAAKVLPEIPAYHFDMAGDYVAVKNARYLILSNSSFALFPVMTSDTLRYVIAPKYWARYNLSDGYWASEQNIYSFLNYQDRKGRIFTADECRRELEEYKSKNRFYSELGHKPEGIKYKIGMLGAKMVYYTWFAGRIRLSLMRRLGLIRRAA